MDDLISRQAAIDAVSKACFELRGVFGRCEDALKTLPSAQPEQKKGKWVESIRQVGTKLHPDYPDYYSVFYCTSCLETNDKTTKYCPNCGARMDGE